MNFTNGKEIMKTCQKCNSQNPDDAKYCWSCGQEIQQTGLKCPHCNQIILENDEIKALKYCPFCGTDLAAQGNIINGHEYVDLGLSVKWATCNIGASSPSEYGDYYAWGEVNTKSEYTEKNCRIYGSVISDISGSSHDVARVNWGGLWRLPTMVEFEELKNKCIWSWGIVGAHYGYKVQGPNEKNIFFPAAGWRYGTKLENAEFSGSCWCSTPGEDCYGAYNLKYSGSGPDEFGPFVGDIDVDWRVRCYGCSVRPVLD